MRKGPYVAGLIISLLVLLFLMVLFGPLTIWEYNSGGTIIAIGFPLILPFVFVLILLIFSLRGEKKGRWGGFPPFVWCYTYGDEEDAFEILDERYARGEISREQYLQMSEDLRRRRDNGQEH